MWNMMEKLKVIDLNDQTVLELNNCLEGFFGELMNDKTKYCLEYKLNSILRKNEYNEFIIIADPDIDNHTYTISFYRK